MFPFDCRRGGRLERARERDAQSAQLVTAEGGHASVRPLAAASQARLFGGARGGTGHQTAPSAQLLGQGGARQAALQESRAQAALALAPLSQGEVQGKICYGHRKSCSFFPERHSKCFRKYEGQGDFNDWNEWLCNRHDPCVVRRCISIFQQLGL